LQDPLLVCLGLEVVFMAVVVERKVNLVAFAQVKVETEQLELFGQELLGSSHQQM
jgi:hypothetical protein